MPDLSFATKVIPAVVVALILVAIIVPQARRGLARQHEARDG